MKVVFEALDCVSKYVFPGLCCIEKLSSGLGSMGFPMACVSNENGT